MLRGVAARRSRARGRRVSCFVIAGAWSEPSKDALDNKYEWDMDMGMCATTTLGLVSLASEAATGVLLVMGVSGAGLVVWSSVVISGLGGCNMPIRVTIVYNLSLCDFSTCTLALTYLFTHPPSPSRASCAPARSVQCAAQALL